jgi:peptidoglycan/LPS O-acetylase OafA/YrhL
VNFVLTRVFWTDVFLPIPGNVPHPAVVPLLYLARFALTILVAAISFRYLEAPLLKLKARFA